ncbi:MAG: hypothetical protein AB9835_08670 [Eubacteriales bacterium]
MRKTRLRALLCLMLSLALLASGCAPASPPDTDATESSGASDITVYVLDKDVTASSGFFETDMVRLCTTLQGLLNRDYKDTGVLLYQDLDESDLFWLEYMRGDGKFLNGSKLVRLTTRKEFFETFLPQITQLGIILWDPEVPATSNVASTICGVDGYLPVKNDTSEDSLHSYLLESGVPVRQSLVGMFTGEGTLPDTDIKSTGSAKNDAYLWAMEKYMSETSYTQIAYTLDGAGTVPGNPIYEKAEGKDARYNAIYSHDYYIMKKMFFFDLTIVDTEAPCDDPKQKLGTDRQTVEDILTYMYYRANGEMIQLLGFPPWWMKYTTFLGHGRTEPVTLEWAFTEFITGYNCVKEADAAHPAWMTNGSVYTSYPLSKEKYENNRPDSIPSYDPDTYYFTFYMGDYDSSAWLKTHVANFWQDGARGTLPLMWGFNPNLSDRVPMVWEYVMENLSENDYIVSGDSGAGYVIPSALIDPDLREFPDGTQAWIDYNKPYFDRFSLDSVGFIINGNNRVSRDIMEMYNKIAPAGSFHNDSTLPLTIYKDTPYIYLQNGIDPNSDGVEGVMFGHIDAMKDRSSFTAFRTICQSPSDVKKCVDNFIEYAQRRDKSHKYVCVDPYTLFELAKQSGQGNVIK